MSDSRWQAMFDSWADEDPNLASTGGLASSYELDDVALQIGDAVDLDGSQRVLDVGCASASLTSRWAPRAASVVGLDFSAPLLDVARHRFRGSNMKFVRGDAARLPFADGSFDVVVCFGVLLCLPDHHTVHRCIDEILRVARPDCRILLGSMPDLANKEVFFDHCDSLAPWYQRAIPRRLRWQAKRLLRPGCQPGQTEILWFETNALAEQLRRRGFLVEVAPDPEFTNYAAYRNSLLLGRGTMAPAWIRNAPEEVAETC